MMKLNRKLFCVLFAFLILLPNIPVHAEAPAEEDSLLVQSDEDSDFVVAAKEAAVDLSVVVHQQTVGTSQTVKNGKKAGVLGQGLRLEAVWIGCKLPKGVKGTLTYQAYLQDAGWQNWVTKGHMAGTTGESRRLEAIRIKLTDSFAKEYDVYYRTYLKDCGWLDWTKNGLVSGTVGQNAALEGIQVLVVKKKSGSAPTVGRYHSITSRTMNTISYSGHIQGMGDVAAVEGGQTLGTTGRGKRLEGIRIRLSHGADQLYGSVKYEVHCQGYGWVQEAKEGTLAGTSGEGKRIEAIRLSLIGDISNYCDIYYRVHVQGFGWLSWAKNGENAGTVGFSRRVEAIEIRLVVKGANAPGSMVNPYYDVNTKYQGESAGYALLAPYLDMIINTYTTPNMSREQKLKALYDHCSTHYNYKSLQSDHPANFTADEYYAYLTVTRGEGNCFGMNYLFGHLAKRIGYPQTRFVKGGLGPYRQRHGWVTIDGKIYDAEIKWMTGAYSFGVSNGQYFLYYED